MKVKVELERGMRIVGTNEKGHQTTFDTSVKGGGEESAASPIEVLLEAAAACAIMDIVPMLNKMRKTVGGLSVAVDADRASTDPKVVEAARYHFTLVSPDATASELERAIMLSLEKYCSVSVTLARAGAQLSWTSEVVRG